MLIKRVFAIFLLSLFFSSSTMSEEIKLKCTNIVEIKDLNDDAYKQAKKNNINKLITKEEFTLDIERQKFIWTLHEYYWLLNNGSKKYTYEPYKPNFKLDYGGQNSEVTLFGNAVLNNNRILTLKDFQDYKSKDGDVVESYYFYSIYKEKQKKFDYKLEKNFYQRPDEYPTMIFNCQKVS